jgi:hypothetical protein
MKIKGLFIVFAVLVIITPATVATGQTFELNHFPMDSLDGIISQTNLQLDRC